jgi:hypothetical protein
MVKRISIKEHIIELINEAKNMYPGVDAFGVDIDVDENEWDIVITVKSLV